MSRPRPRAIPKETFPYEYPKKLSHVYWKPQDILDALMQHRDPLEIDNTIRKMNLNKAMEVMDSAKLFVPNDGSNGMISPKGHFIPCGFYGHMYLTTILGMENVFYKNNEIDMTAEIVAERNGWYKISDCRIYSIARPTRSQISTIEYIIKNHLSKDKRKIETMTESLEDNLSHAVHPPLEGYNSFSMKSIPLTDKYAGLV
jgi:hypothetical protein